MKDSANGVDQWVGRTCEIALSWRLSGATIGQLFADANPDLTDRQVFLTLAGEYLASHSRLIEAWQQYSWDKRVGSGPYLDHLEVGRYEDGRQEVHIYADATSACADFIYREASAVLGG